MSRIFCFVAATLLALTLAQVAAVGMARASSAIRNEPGDPYMRPARLPKPIMICAVGVDASIPLTVCRARLATPLSLCRCYGVDGIGRRYFTYEPILPPTIFSFDGYAR